MKRGVFEEQEKMEFKGLDLVRRDWSQLTREVSEKVLVLLMHSEGIDGVNKYLEEVNSALDDFEQKKDKKNNGKGMEIEDDDSN